MGLILRHYKAPRVDPRKDAAYLRWLRTLPCLVCGITVRIEAAHVGERGLGQKCPDRQAVPLCELHHRLGPHSHHTIGRKFWTHWKLSRYDAIARYNQLFDTDGGNQ